MTALRAFLRPIRQGAAMALVCAFCLPLSQCKQGQNATPPPAKQTLEAQFFPQSNSEFTYEYAVGELGFTLRGICTLLAFTWPLLWILAGRKWMESRFAWILHSLELPLCFGTFYMLFVLTFGGETLYGGYVAVISIGLFACTALAYLVCSFWLLGRKLWNKTRRPGDQGTLSGGSANLPIGSAKNTNRNPIPRTADMVSKIIYGFSWATIMNA